MTIEQDDEAGLLKLPAIDRAHAVQIARLYKIVFGRPPDRVGLAAFLGHMRSGATLEAVAKAFLASDEFAAALNGESAIERLCKAALGRGPSRSEASESPAAIAVRLVQDPEANARLPSLPLLFPDGLPLNESTAYSVWLEEARHLSTALGGPPETMPLPGGPLVSFVFDLRNPDPDRLEAALQSIVGQNAPSSQVVLQVGPRVSRRLLAELRRMFKGDNIQFVRTLVWMPSFFRCSPIIKRCSGTFLCWLGEHDIVDTRFVSELARVGPDVDLVTTDEDEIGPNGEFRNPIFGSAWDPDAALAQPPAGLVLVRRSSFNGLGGRTHRDTDWEFALRAAAKVGRDRVAHLPIVAVHRAHRASLPRTTCEDVVRRHLVATGQGRCTVQAVAEDGPIRVTFPLPAAEPKVTVIIPTRDRLDLLRSCVTGVLNGTFYRNLELIIVDNDSEEPATAEYLLELSSDRRVRVLPFPGAFNWSAMNNRAVRASTGEILCLLNNDIEVIEPNWMRELVSHAIRSDVGLVGAKLLYPDRTVQHAGIVLGPNGRSTHVSRHVEAADRGYRNHLSTVRTVTAVTGACVAMRRRVFEEVGGIEEHTLQVTWSDVDLCLRVQRAGYRVVWTPHALLYHIEQATRGSDETAEARPRVRRELDYMRRTWGSRLDFDPFFSPNLEPCEGQPRLATVPRTSAPAVRRGQRSTLST